MKHPHAEVIKAWADGKPVQFRANKDDVWRDLSAYSDERPYQCPPSFFKPYQYRIKPEEVVDYTLVVGSGVPCAMFFTEKEKARAYYVSSIHAHIGYLERTTVDGKVVKMEFIPK